MTSLIWKATLASEFLLYIAFTFHMFLAPTAKSEGWFSSWSKAPKIEFRQ